MKYIWIIFKWFYLYLDDDCVINGGDGGDEPGKQCIFPFSYKGITYTECTTYENNGIPWCSTEVDTTGNYIDGKWGNCNSRCPTATLGKYCSKYITD